TNAYRRDHICPSFSFHSCGDHPDLHSFPTRRSSDLCAVPGGDRQPLSRGEAALTGTNGGHPPRRSLGDGAVSVGVDEAFHCAARSEEHTSELQSRENLVCRLLLEKKNAQDPGHAPND